MLKLTGTGEVSNIVDVSNCDAYKDKHCKYETSIMFTESNLCSNFPNCHYRQLKRLEQKLEKIKGIVTKYSQHEGYLLDSLFTDLVDELNEVLKDREINL